jgi:hypothetical protein
MCNTTAITLQEHSPQHNVLPDSLFTLSFPNLWLHIPFGYDVRKRSPYNGSLEFLGPTCAFLCLLLFLALFVFTPVTSSKNIL